MIVFLFVDPDEDEIMLSAPAESEDGTARGTLRAFLHPGEDYRGYTYEELLHLGPGRHELLFPRKVKAGVHDRQGDSQDNEL